jgi:hypothetical protein
MSTIQKREEVKGYYWDGMVIQNVSENVQRF